MPVGGGLITTYTFGRDLYDDMLAAIDGAKKQILFETYIWKGDEIGWKFKTALTAAADARASTSTASTTASPTSSSPPRSSGSRPRSR